MDFNSHYFNETLQIALEELESWHLKEIGRINATYINSKNELKAQFSGHGRECSGFLISGLGKLERERKNQIDQLKAEADRKKKSIHLEATKKFNDDKLRRENEKLKSDNAAGKNTRNLGKETGTRFALPSGTQWSSVAIRVSHLKMTVDVEGKRYCVVDAKDIPIFYDGRKKGMTQSELWDIFANWAANGTVSGDDKKISKKISKIRLALKECFAMTENPLPCKKGQWKTAFILSKI